MNDKYLSYLNFDTSLKAFLRAFVVTASEKGILNDRFVRRALLNIFISDLKQTYC